MQRAARTEQILPLIEHLSVKPTPPDDLRKRQKPMEEALALRHCPGFGGGPQAACRDGLPQAVIGRVGEEAVGEGADGLFHRLAQSLADAGAGVEGILAVALDQAFRRSLVAGRQAADVEQPIEHREISKQAVGRRAESTHIRGLG